MQISRTRRRSGIGLALLLAASLGLGGCFPMESDGNIADAYEEMAGFCGFLQDCGGNGNGDMGNRTSNSSDESSSDDSDSGDPNTSDPDTTTGE
jgi:hypothetical protein